MFFLPILSCCTGSCLSILVHIGTHCIGSAAKRVGCRGIKHTSLWVWCWQHYSVLEIPPLSPFVVHLPTQFARKESFLLGPTSDSSSWPVLQPHVFASPKQLTFKQQGRANSANRTTTLSQQGFLFKVIEMLTRQRKAGKMGKVRVLMPFLFFTYVDNFRLETAFMFFN